MDVMWLFRNGKWYRIHKKIQMIKKGGDEAVRSVKLLGKYCITTN